MTDLIISAWSKDGKLALGRCEDVPREIDDYLVRGWVVRDTARAFGKATFGEDFSHAGPHTSVQGGCNSRLIQALLDSGLSQAEANSAYEAAKQAPLTELEFDGAGQAVEIANQCLMAYRTLSDHVKRVRG